MSDTKRCASAPGLSDTTTTEAVLNDLKERGYKLWVNESGRLAYEGPSITPVIWHALQANYTKLIKLLTADAIRDDTKRRVSETVTTDATFHECPVDGRPCEVLEPLRAGMEAMLDGENLAMLVGDAKEYGLPCDSCRKGVADARNLSGLRLGRHERRILLSADGEHKKVIYPEEPGRSAEEANRRALRKRGRVGLVNLGRYWPSWERREGEQPPKWFDVKKARSRYWLMGRQYRAAVLTPLGELVVERCRAELESGAPIRWKSCAKS